MKTVRNLIRLAAASATVGCALAAGAASAEKQNGWAESWTHPQTAPEKAALESGNEALRDIGAGKFREATDALTRVAKVSPRNPGIFLIRGFVYEIQHDNKRALADFDHALELAGHPPVNRAVMLGVYFLRAQLYQQIQAYPRARSDYETAMAVAPHDAEQLNNLAWFLATCPAANCRDGGRAVALARAACERTHWKLPGPIDTLAAACAEAGDYKSAVRWQKKAISLLKGKDFVVPARQRLSLYQNANPYREAAQSWTP